MNSPIPVTVHSAMWNVLLCFKKAAFVPPQVQVLLVDSASKPSRCSAITLPWSKLPLLLKCCSVHLCEKPVSVSYSQPAPKEGSSCSKRRQPWNTMEHAGIQDLPNLRAVPGAAPPWHKQLLQTLGSHCSLA